MGKPATRATPFLAAYAFGASRCGFWQEEHPSTLTPGRTNVLIGFSTAAGSLYRVQRSAGLTAPVQWSVVADNVPGTGAIVEVSDPVAVGAPQRFYRVVLLP